MNQELDDDIEQELILAKQIIAEHIAKLTCYDGFCGALDCDKCNPGWWRKDVEDVD